MQIKIVHYNLRVYAYGISRDERLGLAYVNFTSEISIWVILNFHNISNEILISSVVFKTNVIVENDDYHDENG